MGIFAVQVHYVCQNIPSDLFSSDMGKIQGEI